MNAEELKMLEKEVKKRKRVASEWASQLHDLVEDRLPAAFEEIHELADSTYEACKAWKEATERLQQATGTHN
ncbi:MAG: CCE_0567 family metalloprotein [Gammaproteobacteria bacterium]